MSKNNFINRAREQLADIFLPDKERIESLRKLLESEQKRDVTFEEAAEVSSQLVSFYEILAGGRRITFDDPTKLNDTSQGG